MTPGRLVRSVAIVGLGVLVAGVVAALGGWPARDAVLTMVIAGASALAAAVGGALLLHRFRSRSLRTQTLVVALSPLVALVAGITAAAGAMFISQHDLRALIVIAAVSAAVAVGAALQLGDVVGAGTEHVTRLATSLGEGGTVGPLALDGPEELAALAERLAEASENLEQSRRRERALEASRRELIAWVSHDLRSPLATIRAMAEALDDGVVDDAETVARYHAQIRRDAERLTALVDDLFELSRISSGLIRLDGERVDLGDVVSDALAGARAHAEVKGVRLVDNLGPLPRVEVSAPELSRALHNLLDNAIRHTPVGGSVVLEGGDRSGAAMVSISDECGGIPDGDITRVFEVAFRGDGARAREDGGGGLGLAIARGLVEAHDGTIEVANHDGGCRFTIHLPTAP